MCECKRAKAADEYCTCRGETHWPSLVGAGEGNGQHLHWVSPLTVAHAVVEAIGRWLCSPCKVCVEALIEMLLHSCYKRGEQLCQHCSKMWQLSCATSEAATKRTCGQYVPIPCEETTPLAFLKAFQDNQTRCARNLVQSPVMHNCVRLDSRSFGPTCLEYMLLKAQQPCTCTTGVAFVEADQSCDCLFRSHYIFLFCYIALYPRGRATPCVALVQQKCYE